jgi:hypothetical protein
VGKLAKELEYGSKFTGHVSESTPMMSWSFYRLSFYFFRSSLFFFLIKSWNVWANFFQTVVSNGNSYIFFIFLKTSVFETCNV